MSTPLSLSLKSSSKRWVESERRPWWRKRVVCCSCSCSRRIWFWRSWFAAAVYVRELNDAPMLDTSSGGTGLVGRLRMLLNRLKEKGFVPCGWTWKGCMPESWCGNGVRSDCASLWWGQRDVWDEGRDSTKLAIDPRRRGAAEVADENDERRRRLFWRVNCPVITPNARDSELECECCEDPMHDPQSTSMEPSLTASSAMPESFTS
jgi:hypothetical protein